MKNIKIEEMSRLAADTSQVIRLMLQEVGFIPKNAIEIWRTGIPRQQ